MSYYKSDQNVQKLVEFQYVSSTVFYPFAKMSVSHLALIAKLISHTIIPQVVGLHFSSKNL